tara:strand:+ start:121 stop:273 length:153 start_codon:yes stop_codon:yes gene_type:complete
MHKVVVIVSDIYEANKVEEVLSEAAEEVTLDFAFDVRIEELTISDITGRK